VTVLAFDLFNFEAGGRKAPGVYDYAGLRQAFGVDHRSPDVGVINEAKEYGKDGRQPFYAALSALSDVLGRRYVGELTHSPGRLGSMIFYDPLKLEFVAWGDGKFDMPEDKWNVARFRIPGGQEILVIPQHWRYENGPMRMPDASRAVRYGEESTPTVLLGDLNETASGGHLPGRRWEETTPKERRHKAMRLPDGTWAAHTAAVDMLIGEWVGRWGEPSGRRIEGGGFHALAELAAAAGMPPEEAFKPTTNQGADRGGEIIIDWVLINDAWLRAGGLVDDTYKVHVPEHQDKPRRPSDHRRISADLYISS
jgi:hypothetical protein